MRHAGLLGAIVLLATAGAADAATTTLASAPIFAGQAQSVAVVAIFNGGRTTVTIKSILISPDAGPAYKIKNGCTTPLAPHATCTASATISNFYATYSTVTVSDPSDGVRAVLDVGYQGGDILGSDVLR